MVLAYAHLRDGEDPNERKNSSPHSGTLCPFEKHNKRANIATNCKLYPLWTQMINFQKCLEEGIGKEHTWEGSCCALAFSADGFPEVEIIPRALAIGCGA